MQYNFVQFWLKFSMRFWISKSWSIFTDPIFKNANIFVDVMPIFESTFQQANIFFIVQSRENWVHDLFQPTYTFLAWIIDFFSFECQCIYFLDFFGVFAILLKHELLHSHQSYHNWLWLCVLTRDSNFMYHFIGFLGVPY